MSVDFLVGLALGGLLGIGCLMVALAWYLRR